MKNQDKEFLWNLLSTYLVSKNPEKAVKIATNVYASSMELPDEIEILVVDFSINKSESSICEVAMNVVGRRCFALERHVLLIGALVEKGILTVNHASHLLGSPLTENTKLTNDKIQNVINIAWLTNEDAKDNVMDADADDLLEVALKEVVQAARLE